ncbi:MAG: GNAT family N-acetyltransferase [Crocinitomicaceae bacterium]
MENIEIRKVKASDNLELATIIRTIFIEHNAPKEGTVYSDPTTDNLSKLFGTLNSELFVVLENGEILGCCGIYPTKGLPENCVEIVKFYITKKGRGKGYGRQLYQACEKRAIELNYTQLYLESTSEFAAAIGMYKKLGFMSQTQPLGQSGHFGCGLWFLKTL